MLNHTEIHDLESNDGFLVGVPFALTSILFLQVGNHVDVVTAKWVAQDAGIGAGVDSYFEYLVKGAILLQDEELMSMFLGEKFTLHI